MVLRVFPVPIIVTVQLTPEAVRALSPVGRGMKDSLIISKLAQLNIDLQQNDPSAADEALKSYFSAVVDDEKRAREVVERLQRLPFVTGAYIKPVEAPPE